ncbi:MAG TPA: hypothetical protein VGO90_10115 [Chthoniobacteraceae bacterium]|nr:hypothetical protein [Chthoniobacteraceae bacterium]
MKVTRIPAPLAGEHLAATSPAMQPETLPDWRQRLNFWAGRALTAEALEIEQEHRAARLAWQGRIPTAGVVSGFEVGLEAPALPQEELATAGYFVHVLPGYGLTVFGEDATVPRPLRIALGDIPIHSVRFRPGGEGPLEAPLPGSIATSSRELTIGGVHLDLDEFEPGRVPWAAVLIARPSELRAFHKIDPNDPCELDLSRDAFADERRVDATTLRWFELPATWETDPLLGNRDDPRWRNRLANFVFAAERDGAERHYLRYLQSRPAGDRWDTVLAESSLFPWEFFGVPLALLSSETDPAGNRRFFLDRASVVRSGGVARARSRPTALLASEESGAALFPHSAGTPGLWRARVDQFAEQLGGLRELPPSEQAARFQFVPPVGLLPENALDFLTTAEAMQIPTAPDQPPDRAATSHFFPAHFDVEAVPIPTEDLNAALAASAPLAPFDFADTGRDAVRVLVPLPQRLFDPRLLVVELEDPFFATELGRLLAVRQDWRQRHDFIQTIHEGLLARSTGPRPDPLEARQLELEAVESAADRAFGAIYVSPSGTLGPWEIGADFTRVEITPATVLFVRLRLDLENPPPQIEVRWRSGNDESRHVWTTPSDAPRERLDGEGIPRALSLWRLYAVSADELGLTANVVSGFTLHLEQGSAGLIDAGILAPQEQGAPGRVVLWSADEPAPSVEFQGGDWRRINNSAHLAAPFEDDFQPEFADGRSLADHLQEAEDALNPAGATPRPQPLSVAAHGLRRVLAELESEAGEADDLVDASFTRAQTNLYRIRKLVLGQSAAQKLLINPAIAVIAEQETAAASADQLGAFLSAAKTRPVRLADVTAITNPPTIARTAAPASGTRATVSRASAAALSTNLGVERTNPLINIPLTTAISTAGVSTIRGVETQPKAFDAGVLFKDSISVKDLGLTPKIRDILGQLPESGPTLPPRGISIGERFSEPAATSNLSYARAALSDLLGQLQRLRLPLVDQTVRSLTGADVSLLELQGRAMPVANSATLRTEAIAKLLTTTAITKDTDEAEVTLAAIDFVEIKSAILRTIERVVQQRRALLQRGNETLAVIETAAAAANARLGATSSPLTEARHDVSVARALRQEEQARVAAINTRRDALIREEVTFLAYVRPRAVDPVRRNAPGWKLENADALAPVPACLQRHDQPPDALRAYVQLFRHAPARWFPGIAPRLRELDTHDSLAELLAATQRSALLFSAEKRLPFTANISAAATRNALVSAFSIVEATRARASTMQLVRPDLRTWNDFHREAEQHSSLGDIIDGRHGHPALARAAADLLAQIEDVATCLHAEFATAPPALRLAWVERYSQFDQPTPLNNLTLLPRYGSLDRASRRRFQTFADWLFSRVNTGERDAFNLINDLIRICLLLASHAPVKALIAGHLPRPVPVRPGTLIPIRPFDPRLVRVGMEVQVWKAEKIVARARVEDLAGDGEVSARIERVETTTATTTLDQTMRVQFVPAAFGFARKIAQA